MNKQFAIKVSKFLSFVLRHQPQALGIELEKSGWINVAEFLIKANQNKFPLTFDDLKYVVETNDKQRFQFNEDLTKIRAVQGHSIKIEFEYNPSPPPEILYHGTIINFLDSIKKSGLVKGKRHAVHLSPDIDTAKKVGARRGKPIILKIDSRKMFQNNYVFYQSPNNVWLTEIVPPEYIDFQNLTVPEI